MIFNSIKKILRKRQGLFFYILIPAMSLIIFWPPAQLSCFSQNTETFDMSTYYPAPYGVYKILKLNPTDDISPAAACSNRGEMYYDNSDNRIYVCDGLNWKTLSAYWTLVNSSLYPDNNAWNVGIGTPSPGYKLTVADTIHSAKTLTPAQGLETSATRSDAKLLLYDINANNWAGLGVDTGGDVWLRTGTAGSNFSFINASGNVGIGKIPADGYRLDINGKLWAKNIYAVTAQAPVCPARGVSNLCAMTINFPAGRFTSPPAVFCSAGPYQRTGNEPWSGQMCTIMGVTANAAIIGIGHNRSYYLGFDEPTGGRFVYLIAIEP